MWPDVEWPEVPATGPVYTVNWDECEAWCEMEYETLPCSSSTPLDTAMLLGISRRHCDSDPMHCRATTHAEDTMHTDELTTDQLDLLREAADFRAAYRFYTVPYHAGPVGYQRAADHPLDVLVSKGLLVSEGRNQRGDACYSITTAGLQHLDKGGRLPRELRHLIPRTVEEPSR